MMENRNNNTPSRHHDKDEPAGSSNNGNDDNGGNGVEADNPAASATTGERHKRNYDANNNDSSGSADSALSHNDDSTSDHFVDNRSGHDDTDGSGIFRRSTGDDDDDDDDDEGRSSGGDAAITTNEEEHGLIIENDESIKDDELTGSSHDNKKSGNKKGSSRKKSSRSTTTHDPRRVASTSQLEATMTLLPTLPVWIFDFKQATMRWANPAGLKLWNSPNLEEFLARDMSQMSQAVRARGQRVQDRIEKGLFVQEQWTFYPKGKAKTVNAVTVGMRMSDEEDWVCMLSYGLPMPTSSSSSSSTPKNSEDGSPDDFSTSVATLTSVTTPGDEDEEVETSAAMSDDKGGGTTVVDGTPPPPPPTPPPDDENVHDDDDDDDADHDDSNESESEEERDLVQEETLRGVEIIRHLPIAVCQFDMRGKVMFQNPAAYMPEGGGGSDTWSSRETGSSHDEPAGTTPVSLNHSSRGDFLHRFVDRKIAQDILENIQKANADPSVVSYGNMDGNITLEAELHTSNGPKWSSIQLRRTVDPVTSKPVILYSAQDKSDAILAKQEREARVKKSEFLAIMAHEIRTPLHQVTGFIDLLDENMASSKVAAMARGNVECKCTYCNCSTNGRHASKERRRRRQSMESIHDSSNDDFEQQRGYVKLLKASAQQLMTVISDVLDYSKLEVGEMRFECIAYEPLSVIQGSMAAVRGSCDEKGLTLKLGDWNKDIPFQLMGDPNRLRQVLLNLLSNAVKFTKSGGIRVDVKTFCTDDEASDERTDQSWIKFIVSDTGVGVAEENRDLIFQKYQQANLSVARNFGGTGLGLSICQLLVKTMGGSIGVESEFGKGSSFYFTLPVEIPRGAIDEEFSLLSDDEDDEHSRSPVQRSRSEILQPAPKVTQLNILVAEDNKINQKLVSNMLKRMGHHSAIANDGQEAIEMIQQQTNDNTNECAYDVVLMDIQMPKMDGLEATRRLRTMGYNNLPIVGLTASVKRSDYQELGFDDWLPKPILMKDLKTKLLRTKKQRRTSLGDIRGLESNSERNLQD